MEAVCFCGVGIAFYYMHYAKELQGHREDQFKRMMEEAAIGNKCLKGPV
jgi:ferritin-like protein